MEMPTRNPYIVLEGLVQEDDFALQNVLNCVSDHMTRQVVSLAAHQPVADAVRFFATHAFRHIPVTDGPRLVGLLSDRESLQTLLRDRDAKKCPVSAIMTQPVVSIRPHASISEAIHTLLSHHTNCLPVTAPDESLLGVLTTTDVLRAQFCLQRWLETRAPRVRG